MMQWFVLIPYAIARNWWLGRKITEAKRDRWQKRLDKMRSGTLKDYTVAQAEDVLRGIDYTRAWMEKQGGFPHVVLTQDDELFYKKLRAVWDATYEDGAQADPLPIFLERLGVLAEFRRIFHHHVCPGCRTAQVCSMALCEEYCPYKGHSCSECKKRSGLPTVSSKTEMPTVSPKTETLCHDLLCGHPLREHEQGPCNRCSCPAFCLNNPPPYQTRAEEYKRQFRERKQP